MPPLPFKFFLCYPLQLQIKLSARLTVDSVVACRAQIDLQAVVLCVPPVRRAVHHVMHLHGSIPAADVALTYHVPVNDALHDIF